MREVVLHVMRSAVLSVVYLVTLVSMALFDLQSFIDKPSIEQFDSCRKDDLLKIVDYYKISVVKKALKKNIKSAIFERLVELRIFTLPSVDAGETGPLGAGAQASSVGMSDEERSEMPRLTLRPRPRPSCCPLIRFPLVLLGLRGTNL